MATGVIGTTAVAVPAHVAQVNSCSTDTAITQQTVTMAMTVRETTRMWSSAS